MAEKIKRCTIVSGGPEYHKQFLIDNIDLSSFIIAADSGYLKLKDAGINADLIVADFDSSSKPEYNCEIEEFPIEKDATDTFNAVKSAVKRNYNEIIIFFALGNRFDHSYSNLLCLDYCSKHGVNCVLLDPKNRVSIISKKAVIKKEYQFFSIFAFMDECKGVTIDGAFYTASFYNKTELNLKPYEQFGQSNHITGDSCTIKVNEGRLLLIEAND